VLHGYDQYRCKRALRFIYLLLSFPLGCLNRLLLVAPAVLIAASRWPATISDLEGLQPGLCQAGPTFCIVIESAAAGRLWLTEFNRLCYIRGYAVENPHASKRT
jgi:hypothetical protein